MAKNNSPAKKHFPVFLVLGSLIVVGILAAAGGLAFAASQESHDAFCASCHTQPESTFYQRSIAGLAVDLGSFHTTQNTRCIDCHSGQGITGRIAAELQGAHNALLWYTGKAVQPAVLTSPISDGNCLKCHQPVTQQGYVPQAQITLPGVSGGGREGGEGHLGHWHQFLARWQAASTNAGSCVSCHQGHATTGTAQSGFMTVQNVQQVCNACHQVLREGR
jgi:predicted CXXCH cytochrome family protein